MAHLIATADLRGESHGPNPRRMLERPVPGGPEAVEAS